MTRPIDPSRRALPFKEWPDPDKIAWEDAVTAGDVFDGGGTAAHWATATKRTNIQHYGRWLGYLKWQNTLNEHVLPRDRITRAAVREYHHHLEEIVAPHTQLSMLVGLKVVAQAMTDDKNSWRWLQDVCNRLQHKAKPITNKRVRMRPTSQIYEAALGALGELPRPVDGLKQARAYRDAFMVALLATRPLRLKNFAGLEIGTHLMQTGHTWMLVIPSEETKNGDPIEFTLPDRLVFWLERYLEEVRPRLWDAGETNALWLGHTGALRNAASIYIAIMRTTEKLLGVAINPHLFRDAAATFLSLESPDVVGAATPLLGHRHRSTTERYYIQADNLAASRKINDLFNEIRNGGSKT